jgi:hypothetical protein
MEEAYMVAKLRTTELIPVEHSTTNCILVSSGISLSSENIET